MYWGEKTNKLDIFSKLYFNAFYPADLLSLLYIPKILILIHLLRTCPLLRLRCTYEATGPFTTFLNLSIDILAQDILLELPRKKNYVYYTIFFFTCMIIPINNMKMTQTYLNSKCKLHAIFI